MAKKSRGIGLEAPAPRLSAQDRKWQAWNDLSTLRRADEIRGDKSRMRMAKQIAKKDMKALGKLVK